MTQARPVHRARALRSRRTAGGMNSIPAHWAPSAPRRGQGRSTRAVPGPQQSAFPAFTRPLATRELRIQSPDVRSASKAQQVAVKSPIADSLFWPDRDLKRHAKAISFATGLL